MAILNRVPTQRTRLSTTAFEVYYIDCGCWPVSSCTCFVQLFVHINRSRSNFLMLAKRKSRLTRCAEHEKSHKTCSDECRQQFALLNESNTTNLRLAQARDSTQAVRQESMPLPSHQIDNHVRDASGILRHGDTVRTDSLHVSTGKAKIIEHQEAVQNLYDEQAHRITALEGRSALQESEHKKDLQKKQDELQIVQQEAAWERDDLKTEIRGVQHTLDEYVTQIRHSVADLNKLLSQHPMTHRPDTSG